MVGHKVTLILRQVAQPHQLSFLPELMTLYACHYNLWLMSPSDKISACVQGVIVCVVKIFMLKEKTIADYASGVSSCVLLNHGEKAENISQIFCIPPKPFFVRITEANADSNSLTAESGMARKPTTSSTT